MAVAFRSVNTAGGGTQASPLNITKPSGTADNTDVLVLHFYMDSSGTVTLPSGFTARETTNWDVNWQSITASKLCGTEGASYSISWTGGSQYVDAIIAAYSGCDASSADAHLVNGDGSGSTANTGTGTTATGTGITVDRADSLLLWHAISDVGARSGAPTPGSWTNRSTFDTNMYLDTLSANAGATGNFTSSYSSQEWVVHLLGLRPSAGGGGGGEVTPQSGLGFIGGMGGGFRAPRRPGRGELVSRAYSFGRNVDGNGQFCLAKSGLYLPKRLAA